MVTMAQQQHIHLHYPVVRNSLREVEQLRKSRLPGPDNLIHQCALLQAVPFCPHPSVGSTLSLHALLLSFPGNALLTISDPFFLLHFPGLFPSTLFSPRGT